MKFDLLAHWYKPSWTGLSFILYPFSCLFALIVAIRRFFYKTHIFKSTRLPCFVIVVGNITVGGTGKTPFVIWLAKLLKQQGYQPGIVSRGAGGKVHKQAYRVEKNSLATVVGDEAILLARHADCPVVISVNRVAAAKSLLPQCNIIISDDGLQHYALQRDMEIVLIDAKRGMGNGCLLPAGPLRESVARLEQVDYVIANGQGNDEADAIMTLMPGDLISLANQASLPIHSFVNQRVHAVAGIGNPARFFQLLEAAGLELIEHIFPDHYLYQASDFNFQDDLPILMTEKDAVKCGAFADKRYWYLPVKADLPFDFSEALLRYMELIKKY